MPAPIHPIRHRALSRSSRRLRSGRWGWIQGLAPLLLLTLPPTILSLATPPVASSAPALDPQKEVQLLMDQGVELALGVIRSGFELRPFAFVMRPDGKVVRLVPNAKQKSIPSGQLLISLEQGLRKQASSGDVRATALFVDVVIMRAGVQSDAIQARLEHSAGYCVDVFYAYRVLEDGEVEFEPPVTTAREGAVFDSCGSGPAGAGEPPGAK